MEINEKFIDGAWSRKIDVSDFVYRNITPYTGDASFLCGPTEKTRKLWAECLAALEEERKNNGVRSIDAKTISTITSHKAGYIDKETNSSWGSRQTSSSRGPSSLSGAGG